MATLIDKYFSRIDFDAITTAVKDAELSTGGEIAVEITARCKNWTIERLIYSLILAAVCGVAALYFTREDDWGMYYNFTQTALWGAVGFLAGYYGLGQFLRRGTRRQKVVWFRALDRFKRLDPVRNLAGVLIFVSLEENEAAIVADEGIASKVSSDLWQTLRERLVDAFKQGKHAEGIIKVVESVGVEMATHFPREDDDVNELPDGPTIVS